MKSSKKTQKSPYICSLRQNLLFLFSNWVDQPVLVDLIQHNLNNFWNVSLFLILYRSTFPLSFVSWVEGIPEYNTYTFNKKCIYTGPLWHLFFKYHHLTHCLVHDMAPVCSSRFLLIKTTLPVYSLSILTARKLKLNQNGGLTQE